MPANRITNVASAVTLTLATEVTVVTVTPAPGFNQVPAGVPAIDIEADITITGVASATTCTLRIRRGAGTGGTDITGSDPVLSVDAAATDRTGRVTIQDTAAGFNGANGVYTLTATAAGAAQTARLASLTVHPTTTGI